jgi:hypothetical protein
MDSWRDAVVSGLSSDKSLHVDGIRIDEDNQVLKVGLCPKNTHVKLEIKDKAGSLSRVSRYCSLTVYDKFECDEGSVVDFTDDFKVKGGFVVVNFQSAQSMLEAIKKKLDELIDWKLDVSLALRTARLIPGVRVEEKSDLKYVVWFERTLGNDEVLKVNVSMSVICNWIRIVLNFEWNVLGNVFKSIKKLRIRYPIKQDELLKAISVIESLIKPYNVSPRRKGISMTLAEWCPAILDALKEEWTVRFNRGEVCMENQVTVLVVLVLDGGGMYVNKDVILDVQVEFRMTQHAGGSFSYSVVRADNNMRFVEDALSGDDGVDMDHVIERVKLISLDLVNCNGLNERKDFESRVCAGLIRAGFWAFTNCETLGFFSDDKEGYFVDREKNQYKIKYEDHTSMIYSFELTLMNGISKTIERDNVFGAEKFSESVISAATELRTFLFDRKKSREGSMYPPATLKILERLTNYLVQFKREWKSSQDDKVHLYDAELIAMRNDLKSLLKLIPKRRQS